MSFCNRFLAVGLAVWLGAASYPVTGQTPSPTQNEAENPVAKEIKELFDQGGKFYVAGKHSEAIPYFEKILALKEKFYGAEHYETAATLNDLGVLHRANGDFKKVESYLNRALAIQEKALGPTHPDVGRTLLNLGLFYTQIGVYAAAETCYLRALPIWEKSTDPKKNIDLGLLHNNLGGVYNEISDHIKAEAEYRQGLSLYETVPNNQQILQNRATTCDNLGLTLRQRGDLAQALAFHEQAFALRNQTYGPDHPQTAKSYLNLGSVFLLQGESGKAAELLNKALAILEKTYGKEHQNLIVPLLSFADLHSKREEFEPAAALLQRAQSIAEKTWNGDHPTVARCLVKLAENRVHSGNLAEARQLLERALAIRLKTFGPNHPQTASVLNYLALLSWGQGNYQEAVEQLGRSNQILEQDLVRNLSVGSENQKLKYQAKIDPIKNQTISFHTRTAKNQPEAARLALTMILNTKGRSLDAMADVLHKVRQNSNPADGALLDELSRTRSQLAALLLKEPGKQGASRYQEDIKSLEEAVEQLEGQLSRKGLETRLERTAITLEALQSALPEQSALVEYATYRPFDPLKQVFGEARLAVYVLKKTGEPRGLDLGPLSIIEPAVGAWRNHLREGKANPKGALQTAGRKLDSLIFQPVRKLLGGTTRLLISPDGVLNLIPYDALVDEKGLYAVNHYEISYLTSGRDLLRFQLAKTEVGTTLVVADPDYSQGPGPQIGGVSFAPLERLAGTAEEAASIGKMFPNPTILTKGQATKQALLAAQNPFLLHIATHGQFLADMGPVVADISQRNLTRLDRETDLAPNLEQLRKANPLFRSWLFFAGANHANEQSVLTAYEAIGLKLSGTRLVVLSACDTGLGKAVNGDGVYGLRRALVLAGSETQMMSLWPVSDQGTKDLMVGFYKRLRSGASRSAALRQVRLELLKNPNRNHPFYWAGFILSGEWKEL
ncbi:MAG: CHAT domain-containing protein [Blastocatellia bacterium]|nr:CHAT domain-containing protein [Blastocatellia bacterium]